MTTDEIRMVIDQLQRRMDEKGEESKRNAWNRRGYEAAGYVYGLSYAIGALETAIGEE